MKKVARIQSIKACFTALFILANISIAETNIIKTEYYDSVLELSIDNIQNYLCKIGVKKEHISIITSQVILETGWLQSEVCLDYNNLCGLYNTSKSDFYNFNTWQESLDMYYTNIYLKYNDTICYYEFLENWGYAEDSLYISKLKSVCNNLKQTV